MSLSRCSEANKSSFQSLMRTRFFSTCCRMNHKEQKKEVRQNIGFCSSAKYGWEKGLYNHGGFIPVTKESFCVRYEFKKRYPLAIGEHHIKNVKNYKQCVFGNVICLLVNKMF
ncbi:hypothetical protein GOODEAATRI_008779 [Goodea atripinnis]|uniref:Uncharacterized protein n=1 Tax=Goodea atripinnis TaxID=208336 RepID=A0ABV0MG75_9TELE